MTDVATITEPNELYNDRIDRLIWKSIGVKSVRDIAKETGLTPEQVLRRKSELIDSVDVLTVQQSRQKLISDLRAIADKTRDDYEAAPFEFKSGLMNSAISAMKTVLVELSRAEKKDEGAVKALNDLRRKEIVQMYIDAVNTAVPEICKRFDLDETEVFEVFNSHLTAAALKRDI